MLLISAALALLCQKASAVFADEAYTLDYHYALLGEPQESTTFFHRPNPESRASLIYTLSEQRVVGALNPKDGSVVWRQQLSTSDSSNNTFLRASDGADIVVSGIGNEVIARSAGDGKVAWTYKAAGSLKDLEILDYDVGKDTIALSEHAIVRLDDSTGAVKWEHKLDGSDAVYQVSVSARTLYVVLLHKTLLGYYKVKVVSLDPSSGKKEDEYSLSSENELASADTILTVGANTASPIVAWTDTAYSVLKVNVLGSKNIASFNIKGSAVEKVVLHAPSHVNSLPHFLAHYQAKDQEWADVFHIDVKSSKVDRAYSLPTTQERSTYSTSTIGSNVYFTKISATEVLTVSSASHGVLGRWSTSRLSNLTPEKLVNPLFATTELSVKGDSVSAIRSAVWLSNGELVLVRDGASQWSRPELLVNTIKAEFKTSQDANVAAKSVAKIHPNPVTAFVLRLRKHYYALKFGHFNPYDALDQLIHGDNSHSFGFAKDILCTTSKGWTVLLQAGSAGRIKSICPILASEETIADAAEDFSYKQVGDEVQSLASGQQIWSFTPKNGERILDIKARPQEDPVASIGIVLGNRDVLYKYLNPNLALITTASDALKTASFHIIDTVSGAILYASTHSGVDLSMPVTATVSENWFAFSFTAESSATSPKGHFLVGGELYESLASNDRGILDAAANFSSLAAGDKPYVLTQTYHISEPISKMAVTATRQGITTKQLLVVLPDSNSIVGIPRMAIDPRRPNREPTKNEQMEGLSKYTPNLEFDPKWHLNHKREVLGVKDVITSPALLESTSLIFAYGLDVFGTRLSPSFNFDMLGKDFNKIQMLATVAALFVATIVVGPLVARKQVNQRWTLFT